jgi:hypothetical protein
MVPSTTQKLKYKKDNMISSALESEFDFKIQQLVHNIYIGCGVHFVTEFKVGKPV